MEFLTDEEFRDLAAAFAKAYRTNAELIKSSPGLDELRMEVISAIDNVSALIRYGKEHGMYVENMLQLRSAKLEFKEVLDVFTAELVLKQFDKSRVVKTRLMQLREKTADWNF